MSQKSLTKYQMQCSKREKNEIKKQNLYRDNETVWYPGSMER